MNGMDNTSHVRVCVCVHMMCSGSSVQSRSIYLRAAHATTAAGADHPTHIFGDHAEAPVHRLYPCPGASHGAS